ncbi:MAG: 50S ribosomal protein L3 [Phycisphaeraceae bacterium]|nr:MAG: 50S ribosomal protein L3 [Phycisphaeraceae bacterium]
MPAAIIGRKIGMTRYFTEDGRNVPVTVIQAGPCAVTQVKTEATDGYSAVQLAFEDVKPRRSTIPVIGHDHKAGVSPKRVHREYRLPNDKAASGYELGQTVNVSAFENVRFIDVIGTSKGKGFQGVMKRHHFAGQEASHGCERKHRSPGSIASHATNRGRGPKPKSGKRMAGHMGHERVTVRSLDVVSIDPAKNLMLVRGSVPGPNSGLVFIREAIRLSRAKSNALKGKKGK